jgi:hypothetical protein
MISNKFKDSTLPSSHWSQELSRLPYYFEDLLKRLDEKQNVVHFLAVKSLVLEITFSEDYPKSPPKTSVFSKVFLLTALQKYWKINLNSFTTNKIVSQIF